MLSLEARSKVTVTARARVMARLRVARRLYAPRRSFAQLMERITAVRGGSACSHARGSRAPALQRVPGRSTTSAR
eukprot:5676946-Prymnesium_polylepis.1